MRFPFRQLHYLNEGVQRGYRLREVNNHAVVELVACVFGDPVVVVLSWLDQVDNRQSRDRLTLALGDVRVVNHVLLGQIAHFEHRADNMQCSLVINKALKIEVRLGVACLSAQSAREDLNECLRLQVN